MGDLPAELVGVGVENLRGFERAELRLDQGIVVLVGPNNSGKTSILRMLDWAFNGPIEQFESGADLPEQVLDLLRPARSTGNRARRLTLLVRVTDGRRHSRFRCRRGIARLRIGLRLSPAPSLRVNLGPPTKSEGASRDDDAYALLAELRESTHFRLIPAARDAASPSFGAALETALTRRMNERAVHTQHGGTRAEYRKMASALDSITEVAEDLAGPLWEEVQRKLPAGLAARGLIKVDAAPADLVEWVTSRLRFRLSTGAHDTHSVRPTEVGSGLQSLLELALSQAEETPAGVVQITALEEPEAFLHPAAQRTLARDLFQSVPGKRLLSTHSPILVEEARFGDVVLVHDRQFHQPRPQDDETRDEINTALLTRYGAEMVFAQSILLVEGESDREFFENLRRRLATFDPSGRIDRLVTIPTGSKNFFSPWIRLIRSYGDDREGPLNWLALVDGDAATDIRRALQDAAVPGRSRIRAQLDELANANQAPDLAARAAAARRVNSRGRRVRSRVMISPGDLEWAGLHATSDRTARRLARSMGLAVSGTEGLIRALGSKHVANPIEDGLKHPWRRGLLARRLPWTEISADSTAVLQRWLEGAMSSADAQSVLKAARDAE